MPSEERVRRVSNRIHEELAEIFLQEVSDPRLSGTTVTGVEVDRELAYATIFVSLLGSEDQIEEMMEALERAKGFLRSQLAMRISLRSFPQLRFRYDASTDRGARVDELLEALQNEKNLTAEDEA